MLSVSPGTAQEAARTWLRHPHFFAGRALTTASLEVRQRWQEGRVVSRGQGLLAGVDEGLEVTIEQHVVRRPMEEAPQIEEWVRVDPGRALCADGDDVVLTQAISCPMEMLPVLDSGSAQQTALLPLGDWLSSRESSTTAVGILVLQPIRIDIGEFDPVDPSDRTVWREAGELEPSSIEDWHSLDAARLVWCVWPSSQLELPAVDRSLLRNALAWTIFRAEAQMASGQQFAWEGLGVPLALVCLAEDRRVTWVDRASVVRRGARVRDSHLQRHVGPHAKSIGLLALNAHCREAVRWQAQIEQFAEQLAAEAPRPASELALPFGERLPPFGFLPASALQRDAAYPEVFRCEFFPPRFDVDAVPVPIEQLDQALRSSAGLAGLNPALDECVRLLVPVPISAWEPRLLLTDEVAPEFLSALSDLLLTRARTLALRQGWRNRAMLIGRAIDGQVRDVPAPDHDAQALETESLNPWIEAPATEPPAGGGHRSSIAAGVHRHAFSDAPFPMAPSATDVLYTWVCLNPDHPPRSLALHWRSVTPADGDVQEPIISWQHGVHWGEDLLLGQGPDGSSSGAFGDSPNLPPAGQWVRLTVSVPDAGLHGRVVDGMAFTLFDGQAAFGSSGLLHSDGGISDWFGMAPPDGAAFFGDEPWEVLTDNDLWVPFDADGGVVPSLPDPQQQRALQEAMGGDSAAAAPLPTSGHSVLHALGNNWRGHSLVFRSVYRFPVSIGGAAAAQTGPQLHLDLDESKADRLQIWVYLDELTPPRSLWVAVTGTVPNPPVPAPTPAPVVLSNAPAPVASLAAPVLAVPILPRISVIFPRIWTCSVHRSWGEEHNKELEQALPGTTQGSADLYRAMGPLPSTGRWQRLEVFLPKPSAVNNNALFEVTSIQLLAFGGTVAFSDISVVSGGSAGSSTRIWPSQISADGAPSPTPVALLSALPVLQRGSEVLRPTPASRIGTVLAFNELTSDPVIRSLSGHEQSQLVLRGLSGFAEYLKRRIDRADDITDFGFAHMQVDMHRIRQMMLSASDATRLAVSPTLAAIAQGDNAAEVQLRIKDYLASVKATAAAKTPPPPAPSAGTRAAAMTTAGTFTDFSVFAKPIQTMAGASMSSVTTRLLASPNASPGIVFANPVIGLSEVRTTTIAARLKTPPSTEARDYALANRHRTVSSLVVLYQEFSAEDNHTEPALFVDFRIQGIKDDPFLPSADKPSRSLKEFSDSPVLLEQLLQPPATTNTGSTTEDVAAMFTQAVALSDHTVAILRQLEARIAVYRNALAVCEVALGRLQVAASGAAARIRTIEEDLAESRHDVSVARALLQEEEDRVAAVNARRRKVLDEEVKFLAYMRPREVDNLLATPTHAVDPGLMEAPVPACLREHPDVPEELLDMLRVVREAPARWFVKMPALVQKLDRHEPLIRALHSAQQRALAGLAMPLLTAARDNSKLAAAVLKVSGRQAETLGTKLSRLQSLSLNQLKPLSWQAIRQEAEEVLSFADLADGGHGRADVAKAAATELDQIRSIVACLHAEFCAVPAIVRLGWAQLLSEFDEAPNLRNLASLPRWPEIGFIDRRQMQSYVDWLFDQIEPGQPQAVALINDVVRMCLLLASHAPVDRIVAGRMARPVTGVSLGQRIPLTVLDPAQLRIGMQAVIYRGGQVVARAQVEDLGQGEVAARVIHKATERLDLGDDCKVHFDREAAVSLSSASARRSLFGR